MATATTILVPMVCLDVHIRDSLGTCLLSTFLPTQVFTYLADVASALCRRTARGGVKMDTVSTIAQASHALPSW